MAEPAPRPAWRSERHDFSTDSYDARWKEMAAKGVDPHGEVRFVQRYQPASVLDAGCGTGRVAIELMARGVRATGVDVDPEMLAAARGKAPELEWHHSDLAVLDLGARFDVVVLAGNVMIFVEADQRAAVVARLAAHLEVGGRLIAGFQLRFEDRVLTLDDYDRSARAVGLELVERYRTWDGDPYEGGPYAVSVHQRFG
jgi:SAM-dependent methyltransferase